jgi:hypothetical protein
VEVLAAEVVEADVVWVVIASGAFRFAGDGVVGVWVGDAVGMVSSSSAIARMLL